MQLDKTAIAISQRNLDDLLDLSLAVLRRHGMTLIKPAVLGALPFAILNALLLWASSSLGDGYSTNDIDSTLRYMWLMLTLVYIEAPLAMAGVTLVLGNLMFGIQNTRASTLGPLKKQTFPVLWILGCLRMVIPTIVLLGWISMTPGREDYLNNIANFWVLMIGLLVMAVRSFKPFAPEILLLEKCPLGTPKTDTPKAGIHYGMRSSRLHSSGGELFAITLMIGLVALCMLGILIVLSSFLMGSLVGRWSWGWWMELLFYPLSLWTVALWGTVIRFLIYMNTRIRGEGWELELKLKAEARRFKDAQEKNLV